MPAGLENLVDPLLLLIGQPPHLQELGKSEDNVERSAQFMAHAGEKIALRGRRGVRRFLGPHQLSLQCEPLADIPEDDDRCRWCAVGPERRPAVAFQHDVSTAGMPGPNPYDKIFGRTGENGTNAVKQGGAVVGMYGLPDPRANPVTGPDTGEAGRCIADEPDPQVRAND